METQVPSFLPSSYLKVLTVPMRNGNLKIGFWTGKMSLVLTVPMRNGNSQNPSSSCCASISSYRTYEEWKPLFSILPLHAPRVLTVPMRNGNSIKLDFV